MTYKGNLIDLAENGNFDVIVHGCNCFNTMGAGIAKEISSRYPKAFEADKFYTNKGDKTKLGNYTWAKVTGKNNHVFVIINAYTQYYYGKAGKNSKPLLDYEALSSIFETIALNYKGLRIGYPKIGAGLAGGDWNIINNIIKNKLTGFNHHLVVL